MPIHDSLTTIAAQMRAQARPLRLRIALQLWTGEQYLSWRGESWKVEVATEAEGREVHAALEMLFVGIDRLGAAAVYTALQGALDADRLARKKEPVRG